MVIRKINKEEISSEAQEWFGKIISAKTTGDMDTVRELLPTEEAWEMFVKTQQMFFTSLLTFVNNNFEIGSTIGIGLLTAYNALEATRNISEEALSEKLEKLNNVLQEYCDQEYDGNIHKYCEENPVFNFIIESRCYDIQRLYEAVRDISIKASSPKAEA